MKSSARLGGLKEAPASIGGEYFTAALVSEWKTHIAIIMTWIVIIILMVGIVYSSNNL